MKIVPLVFIAACMLNDNYSLSDNRQGLTAERNILHNDTVSRLVPADIGAFENQPQHVDTTFGAWHMSIEQFYHGHEHLDTCGIGAQRYAIYASRITISKDGRPVIKDFVVSPQSFMAEHSVGETELTVGPLYFSPTTCYAYASCCESGTDNCTTRILAFTPSYPVCQYPHDYVMDGDLSTEASFISEFLALCMHELSLPEQSRQSVDEILHAYCSPALQARLADGNMLGNMLWGNGRPSWKWLETTTFESVGTINNMHKIAMRFQKQPDSTQVTRYFYLECPEQHYGVMHLTDIKP